jgi:hypothetical protein
MGQLNSATPEQREVMRRLMVAGLACPSTMDRQAFDEYQQTVMQPLRDKIKEKGNKMENQWQDDDEVVTTFRSLKMTQQENYDAGFAAGVAWARENAQ